MAQRPTHKQTTKQAKRSLNELLRARSGRQLPCNACQTREPPQTLTNQLTNTNNPEAENIRASTTVDVPARRTGQIQLRARLLHPRNVSNHTSRRRNMQKNTSLTAHSTSPQPTDSSEALRINYLALISDPEIGVISSAFFTRVEILGAFPHNTFTANKSIRYLSGQTLFILRPPPPDSAAPIDNPPW